MAADGLTVLNHILEWYTDQSKAGAHNFGTGSVIGVRQSVLEESEDDLRGRINNVLLSIGGIRAIVSDQSGQTNVVQLLSWEGPSSEEPDKHEWKYGLLHQATTAVGTVGLNLHEVCADLQTLLDSPAL